MEMSTGITKGHSLLSSASDAATPTLARSGSCRDLTMRTPPANCPTDRCPSTSASNGRPENERETPNNSLSSGPENSPQITARRRSRRSSGYDRSDSQQRRGHDALVMKLRSELAETRSKLERKDVLAASLQHQLDQRRHIEEQTQARSERDLTVALAEVSALKKELDRTSQLLMDGAVARQQLEQRCSVLKQELEQSDTRAKDLEQDVFKARVQITKVSNELNSRRSTSVDDAQITFAQEVRRVEANAKREIDALREKAGTLREALERRTSLYEEACSERDTAVHEANEAAEKVTNIRQEVWSWRDRAEELEHLEQTERTYLNEAEDTIEVLKQNLAEMQESMEKAREDATTSRGVAAEESAKRAEAETRLETMEADAKAAAEYCFRERMAHLMTETKETIRQQAETLQAQMKTINDAAMEGMIRPLLEKLRKSEAMKDEVFHRVKALEVENGRLLCAIDELHDSTMAVVLQAGINIEFPH